MEMPILSGGLGLIGLSRLRLSITAWANRKLQLPLVSMRNPEHLGMMFLGDGDKG